MTSVAGGNESYLPPLPTTTSQPDLTHPNHPMVDPIPSSSHHKHQQLIDALNLSDSPSVAAAAAAPTNINTNKHDDRPPSPSSALESLLSIGDVVGEGVPLHGHILSRVNLPLPPRSNQDQIDADEPAPTFEVLRKLGTGSYAVVWLVREILSHHHHHHHHHPPRHHQPSDDTIFDFDYSSGSSSTSSDTTSTSPPTSTTSNTSHSKYGRYFALKCLSKANLDDDALAAQLLEANIHQSMPIHPNIVTLHRTLESPAYLCLLLEFVPGEDLFYFLESARDSLPYPLSSSAQSPDHPNANSLSPDALSALVGSISKTPTSPNLLSSLHPNALLSRQRLKLVASMFTQMCDAVATCHRQGVYHRDIKPENFIVTESSHDTALHERKVVVKLTDFGLATREERSADMDCGSAPYMSFECRNNLSPTYAPRPADIWSLGIVLINMLYHHNPWSDTSLQEEFRCASFESYRSMWNEGKGGEWFVRRFEGMDLRVGQWLATNVFGLLGDGEEDGEVVHGQRESERVDADEFGRWVKGLPDMLAQRPVILGSLASSAKTSALTSVTPLPSIPSNLSIGRVGRSRRPSLRSVNGATWIGFGAVGGNGHRVGMGMGHRRHTSLVEPPVADPEIDVDGELEAEGDDAEGEEEEREPHSRAASSSTRRRKRGARNKSKGGAGSSIGVSVGVPSSSASTGSGTRDDDFEGSVLGPNDKLDDLAVRSQLLARELSKAGSWISSSNGGGSTSRVNISVDEEPVQQQQLPPRPKTPTSAPGVSKKKGWKGLWRMTSSEVLSSSSQPSHANAPPLPAVPALSTHGGHHPYSSHHQGLASKSSGMLSYASRSSVESGEGRPRKSRERGRGGKDRVSGAGAGEVGVAANVSSIVMGLSAHPPTSPPLRARPSNSPLQEPGEESRGRKPLKQLSSSPKVHNSMPTTWSPQPRIEHVRPSTAGGQHPNPFNRSSVLSNRAQSPNWRNSVSTTATGSSMSTNFTRYSNGSAKSLDTLASSISSTSWRSGGTGNSMMGDEKLPTTPTSATNSSRSGTPTTPTSNIKIMNGVPWELTGLPRQLHPRPTGDIFGQPPVRKNNKSNQGRIPPSLDTINEQPSWRHGGRLSPPSGPGKSSGTGLAFSPPPLQNLGRKDASTSTTDLTEPPLSPPGSPLDEGADGSEGPKKIQKGQNKSLQKMFSALRR